LCLGNKSTSHLLHESDWTAFNHWVARHAWLSQSAKKSRAMATTLNVTVTYQPQRTSTSYSEVISHNKLREQNKRAAFDLLSDKRQRRFDTGYFHVRKKNAVVKTGDGSAHGSKTRLKQTNINTTWGRWTRSGLTLMSTNEIFTRPHESDASSRHNFPTSLRCEDAAVRIRTRQIISSWSWNVSVTITFDPLPRGEAAALEGIASANEPRIDRQAAELFSMIVDNHRVQWKNPMESQGR